MLRARDDMLPADPRSDCAGGMVYPPAGSIPAHRIVVVEDDRLLAGLLAEMLMEMGHAVVALAATEAEAVAAAVTYKPDLMIVDARLHEGNGVSAIQTILKTGPMPHVFMSGAAVHAGRPGAVVLQKPFRERDLVHAIERAVLGQPPAMAGVLAAR